MKNLYFLVASLSFVFLSYSQVTPAYPVPFRQGNTWGYADTNLQLVIPATYERANVFVAPITDVSKNGKTGFINTKGELVTPFIYEAVNEFRDGYAQVMRNNKIGFIDLNGKEIIKAVYDNANSFNEGLAVVEKNHKLGVINKKGKQIVPFKYTAAETYFSDGFLLVQEDDRIFYVNKKGKALKLSSNITPAGSFSEGYAPVYLTLVEKHAGHADTITKVSFINTKGQILTDSLSTLFLHYAGFKEGKAMVYHEDLIIQHYNFYYINLKGKVSEFFVAAAPFSEGLAPVRRFFKDSAEVINLNYETEFVLDCDAASSFSEGLMRVNKDNKYGFLDKKGQLVIDYQYEEASYFRNGIALVSFNGQVGCIDSRGRRYWIDP